MTHQTNKIMAEYLARPVRVNAVQLTYQNWGEVCDLLGEVVSPENPGYFIPASEASDTCGEEGVEGFLAIKITTTHGEIAIVRHGDFIIPDTKPGTFYPCKPDVFKAKYNLVEPGKKTAEEAYKDALIWYANANYPDDGSGRPVEAYRRHAKDVLVDYAEI